MSKLECWLRKNNMSTKHFADLAQCSRQVILKVKKDMAIDPAFAKRIIDLTGAEVIPIMRPRGGRGCEQFHSSQNDIYCNI